MIDSFTSLVNPGMPIPYYITELTGIDNEMVADAPVFAEIADTLLKYLDDSIFVAHNVGFDFTILQYEFRRVGIQFDSDRHCTVRLSRKHMPELGSFGLGSICRALEIPNEARHRAFGDARATVDVLHHLIRISDGNLSFPRHYKALIPEQIDPQRFMGLPESPGNLFFHDHEGTVIFTSAADNVQDGALQILKKKGQKKYSFIDELVWDATYELSPTGLIAQLRHSYLLDHYRPSKNGRRFKKYSWTLTVRPNLHDYHALELVPAAKVVDGAVNFLTKREAKTYLEIKIRNHQLDPGLVLIDGESVLADPGMSSLSHLSGRATLSAPHAYNDRVEAALHNRFASAHGVFVEKADQGRMGIYLIKDAEYFGYTSFEENDTTSQWEILASVERDPYQWYNQHILYQQVATRKDLQWRPMTF
jgi:DNA polymerase-3 subunit epsilon